MDELVSVEQTVSVELAVCSYLPYSLLLADGIINHIPLSLSVKRNNLISMLNSEPSCSIHTVVTGEDGFMRTTGGL